MQTAIRPVIVWFFLTPVALAQQIARERSEFPDAHDGDLSEIDTFYEVLQLRGQDSARLPINQAEHYRQLHESHRKQRARRSYDSVYPTGNFSSDLVMMPALFVEFPNGQHVPTWYFPPTTSIRPVMTYRQRRAAAFRGQISPRERLQRNLFDAR